MKTIKTVKTAAVLAAIAMTGLVGAASATAPLETARWQAAIDAAHRRGGGVVSVPPGVHPVGQLDLLSNVTLHLEEGAVLEGAAGMENYRSVDLPYSEGAWSGVVVAIGQTNVAITGRGEINGRGERFSMDLRRVPRHVCPEGGRPRGIVFADCADIRLEDFTLRDAAGRGIVFKRCDGVVARRVRIDSHARRDNDGFDVEARNVLIEDCEIDSGDGRRLGLFVDLHKAGFEQVPCGSNWMSGQRKKEGKSADDVMRRLVAFCRDKIAGPNLKGFLMAPWRHITDEESFRFNVRGIDLLAESLA